MNTESVSEMLYKWDDPIIPFSGSSEFTIALFLDEPELASRLSAQLIQFGYTPFVVNKYTEFKQLLSELTPSVIIISTELPEGRGVLLMKMLGEKVSGIPAIYIANNYQIKTHLDAVNTGGIALFSKPFEFTAVLDKLDQISKRISEPAYRILIVDDSESAAIYHSKLLQSAAMQTEIVINPLEIINVLTEFDPDLILMDMYMPECSGADLAKVIRQHEIYNGIPIVFLSSENDMEKQLATMSLGADDFLNKTIDARHLVTSISARVKRARKLRSLMIRDSLSGLLNHSVIKQQLENEVKRAQRTGSNFCYSMLDIDHFKQVNDTYGHLAGDRVIKQLAHLLRQRLRTTDIVGRYGGEEFAVIMPDTSLNSAGVVLNELRETFSEIIHIAEGHSFHCTFSGGIADYNSFPDPALLHDKADKMLYKSKSDGRNRISIAESVGSDVLQLINTVQRENSA